MLPWFLGLWKNIWLNCLKITSQMNFVVSHIYRESNHCADRLANFSLSIQGISFWYRVPVVISFWGLPSFRFVSFWGFWHSPSSFVVLLWDLVVCRLLYNHFCLKKINNNNLLPYQREALITIIPLTILNVSVVTKTTKKSTILIPHPPDSLYTSFSY